jgi:hypothetical protein
MVPDIWQVDKSADGEVVKTKLFGVMVSVLVWKRTDG